MPTITIRHFAGLRERRGTAQETLDVDAGTTLRQLYGVLYPPAPAGDPPVACVRNHATAPPSTEVEDGDEIAFLPPFGGG
jgi:molybdopterin converting factor small subunit